MDDIADLHDRAMEFADQADQVRRQGDLHRYGELIRQAFENERSAATLVAADLQLEPTRSVLHRSTAALAIEAGAPDVALEPIATALEGNPPQAIAEELSRCARRDHRCAEDPTERFWHQPISRPIPSAPRPAGNGCSRCRSS